VLAGGLVSLADNWHWVQTALARNTRVVAFDRAGFGGSEVSPHPRDVQQIAREMHTALHNAGIAGPYVLAGHSFGGLTVRAFADLFPDEVAGLVLVDASHPDQWAHMPVPSADRMLARTLQITALLSHVGIGRLMTGPAKAVAAGLPEPLQRAIVAACAPARVPATEARQMRAWSAVSRDQVNRARPLGSLPLAVISVSEQDLYGDRLTALQDQLATLSGNVRRVTVTGATHYSLLGEKQHAEQVAGAISWAVAAAG
jgi:pimeloyl-ACP methyl ester carboxylesterase